MKENNERLTAVFTTAGAGALIFFGSFWIVRTHKLQIT